MYSVIFPKPWRYRHRTRGMLVLPAGRYDVPSQLREELALQAVAQGMARREAAFGRMFYDNDKGPEILLPPETKPAFVPEIASAPKKRGRGRPKATAKA